MHISICNWYLLFTGWCSGASPSLGGGSLWRCKYLQHTHFLFLRCFSSTWHKGPESKVSCVLTTSGQTFSTNVIRGIRKSQLYQRSNAARQKVHKDKWTAIWPIFRHVLSSLVACRHMFCLHIALLCIACKPVSLNVSGKRESQKAWFTETNGGRCKL